MAAIVLIVPGLAARIAMPALATLLIYASASTIRLDSIRAIRAAGAAAMIAGGTTFVATLLLPIQAAVGLGIALSAMLDVYVSSVTSPWSS